MPTGKEKLGKGPAKIDPRTLKLFNYFTEVLAPPPPNVDYTMGITDWGMMLNGPNSYGPPIPGEGLGDCTIAAPAHAEQVWSAARGGEYTLPDMAVLQKYEQWDGYVAGDDSTDQGGIILDVLNKWRKGTFWEHPLFAYADPAPENLKHICQAIFLSAAFRLESSFPCPFRGSRHGTFRKEATRFPGLGVGITSSCADTARIRTAQSRSSGSPGAASLKSRRLSGCTTIRPMDHTLTKCMR